MITLVFSFSVTVNKADATLASVSDTLSDSRFNTASNHVISFQVKTAALTAGDSIIVAFEDDFTTTSMVFADISMSDGAAVTLEDTTCTINNDTVRVTNYGTDTVTFTLCATTTIADEAIVTITFGNAHITNPATATCGTGNNSYVCDINITTSDETGRAQVAILTGVSVSATVGEVIAFTISDNSVGFGEIIPGTARYADSDETGEATAPAANNDPLLLTLTSNTSGATISIKSVNGASTAGLYSSSTTQTLTAAASTTVSGAPAANGFGVYGADVAGITLDEGFDHDSTSDLAVTTSNLPFAASSTGGDDTVEVEMVAAAAITTTSAADFATTVVFTATPVY